MLESVLEKNH